MTAAVGDAEGLQAGRTGPTALLEALRAGAGGLVDGAAAGTVDDAPMVDALAPARANAVLAAWTGARLHAGLPGLLSAGDDDLALLVGDWCFAHALQALAHGGDLEAIGILASAIGAGAVHTGESEAEAAPQLAKIWRDVCAALTETPRS